MDRRLGPYDGVGKNRDSSQGSNLGRKNVGHAKGSRSPSLSRDGRTLSNGPMTPSSWGFSPQSHQAAAMALGKSSKAAVAHVNLGSSYEASQGDESPYRRSRPSESPTGRSKPSRSPIRSRQPTPSNTPQQGATSFPEAGLDVNFDGSSPDSLAFEPQYNCPGLQRGSSPQRQGLPYGHPMYSPQSPDEQDGAAQWWLSEAKRMRDEAVKVRKERDRLRNALDDSHSEIKRLNTQVSEYMAQLRHTQLALRESKSMADAARQELERLRHWIDEAHTESRQSAAEVQEYEWQLRETRITLENSERSCQDLKNDNENKYVELVKLRKRVSKLEERAGFDNAGKKFDQLEEQLAEAHDDSKKARQELESMRYQASSAQKNLEAERSQTEALRRRLQKYETSEEQNDAMHDLGVVMSPEGMQQSKSLPSEGDGAGQANERLTQMSAWTTQTSMSVEPPTTAGSHSQDQLLPDLRKTGRSALRRSVTASPRGSAREAALTAQRRNPRRIKTSDAADLSGAVDLSSMLQGLSADDSP